MPGYADHPDGQCVVIRVSRVRQARRAMLTRPAHAGNEMNSPLPSLINCYMYLDEYASKQSRLLFIFPGIHSQVLCRRPQIEEKKAVTVGTCT
jgi:hypothetical protein